MKKTTGKASTPAGTKEAKIRLNIGGTPANKITEVLGVEDGANRESPVEISSSSSSQSSPEGSPPPEEHKAHNCHYQLPGVPQSSNGSW
jgi:hypothetical protein